DPTPASCVAGVGYWGRRRRGTGAGGDGGECQVVGGRSRWGPGGAEGCGGDPVDGPGPVGAAVDRRAVRGAGGPAGPAARLPAGRRDQRRGHAVRAANPADRGTVDPGTIGRDAEDPLRRARLGVAVPCRPAGGRAAGEVPGAETDVAVPRVLVRRGAETTRGRW